jgi:tRNA uridine 5-carboxymethylaminomethyl modification enzyme
LTPIADRVGLIDAERRERFALKTAEIDQVRTTLDAVKHDGETLARRLVRTEVGWEQIAAWCPALAATRPEVVEQVVNDVKYAGYVARQEMDVERTQRLAEKRIPTSFDFGSIRHLRNEAREKLLKVRPMTLAQAARISGITPADLALVRVYLEGLRG